MVLKIYTMKPVVHIQAKTLRTMLKEIGVKYVLVIQKVRSYFNKNDAIVNKKVLKAFEYGKLPYLLYV